MKERLVNHQQEPRRPNALAKILLALFALLLTPTLAWAQTSYGITVKHNGTNYRVTSANASNVLGDGTVTYDVTNSVLTLDNASINGCIYFNGYDPDFSPETALEKVFNFKFKGTCFITATDSCAIKNTTTLSLDSNNENVYDDQVYSRPKGTINLNPTTEGGSLTMIPKGNPSVELFQNVNFSNGSGNVSSGVCAIYSQLFSEGTGADGNNPYILKTAADIKNFATLYNIAVGPETYVKLGNDIDCTGLTIETIGSNTVPYSAIFDGNGKTISNLTITPNPYNICGLFSHLHEEGIIQNLTLSNCTISGGQEVGAFVGYVMGGSISNCHTSGCTVSSSEGQTTHAGGIAGYAITSDGTITISGCTVTSGSVTARTDYNMESGYSYAGGILGEGLTNAATTFTISGCEVNSTTITSNHTCNNSTLTSGGIVGNASHTNGTFTISNNIVKGSSKITYLHSAEVMTITCGAIAGDCNNGVTFSDNTYEYSVITHNDTKGYTNRGIGSSDSDVIGEVELAGTKVISVVQNPINGNYGGEYSGKVGTYYMNIMNQTDDYLVVPGMDFTLEAEPNEGHKPRLTLSDTNIEVTTEEINNNAATPSYDHTEFTFTMPDADVTATLTFPFDITPYTVQQVDTIYTGSSMPIDMLTAEYSGSTIGLIYGTDFTVKSYGTELGTTAPTNTGHYTVTIEGIGEFIGTKEIDYNILPVYGLSIKGIQVNGKNKANVLGDNTVSFTPATDTTPNTLTLNEAYIEGTIESSLGNLTIHMTGYNTIKATGTETSLINSTNDGTLTFETDATTGNQLSFQKSDGNYFTAIPINGFASVAYETGLGYYSQFSQIVETLFIEYNGNRYKLYSTNANDIVGDGNVSFSYDSTNGNVLTLNNANIEVIEWLVDNDLTIALNGACSIFNTGHTYAINYYGNLNIVKASGATSAELSAGTTYYPPFGTYGLTLGSGLYLKPISNTSTTITEDPDFVLYNGYAMTNGQTITKGTGTLVYTVSGSEKTLTFTDFQEAFGDGYGSVNAIETGIEGLKVILVGDNTITCNDPDTYAFKGIRDDASIQFVKGGDGCNLTMSMYDNTTNPFNFADGKITYDELVYYSEEKYIAVPTVPTMAANDDNKVELTVEFSGGTIKYSIDYADETTDVTGATYSAPFAMTAPGTVTAWVEANGTTTDLVKGKYFGYKDAPFTLETGGTKTPELIPAIETGDNIGYNATGAYESSATGVATFTSGTIAGTGVGTATVTANIDYTSDVQPVVILNPEKKVTAEVNVGTIPDITFASDMTYATFCNTSNKDLTVPEGLTAYAVTGTNGTVVTLSQVDFLPKVSGTNYVALLLKREDKNTEVGLSLEYDGTASAPTSHLLKYAISDVPTSGVEFVLYKDEFLKAKGTIPEGKCYLDLRGMSAARAVYGISHNDGDDTGINNVMLNEHGVERWYDLQGRRIEKPTKAGLYIRNGEKIVVNDNNK